MYMLSSGYIILGVLRKILSLTYYTSSSFWLVCIGSFFIIASTIMFDPSGSLGANCGLIVICVGKLFIHLELGFAHETTHVYAIFQCKMDIAPCSYFSVAIVTTQFVIDDMSHVNHITAFILHLESWNPLHLNFPFFFSSF